MEEKKKVGEQVYSKHTLYQGEIERITEDAYIIKCWYNPALSIGFAHQRVLFGDVSE